MNKVNIDLENCYGIKKLNINFDFTHEKASALYAPNGSMKSSLAKTFKDIVTGVESKDRIYPSRPSRRIITDEVGNDLACESILVVQSYDEFFGHSEKTSTLLVNSVLRQEYEQLHISTDEIKDIFLKALKDQSGSKKNLEKEISLAFTSTDAQFYQALLRIESELLVQKNAPFADIPYDIIFDEKVLAFLNTKDFKTAIKDYIEKYNELLAASTYFKQSFNYYNAATITKSLADNGFFEAQHSLNLNATEKLEIKDEKTLEALIQQERENISNDTALRKKLLEIERLITKNANVREFAAYIAMHEELLPNFSNIDHFREEIWKSYIYNHLGIYKDVVAKYRAAQKRKDEIEQQAARERTAWEEVIEIFNSRFFVPFSLIAKNRVSVILGQEPMLTLGFMFDDGSGSMQVEKSALMEVLSTGEKKALYILNVLFEIRVRMKANQETLMIVDDIADSFDYKNKYAIIQYLIDIADNANFKQIILTHNFDFFRTINSRFVNYSQCFMATKSHDCIIVNKAAGIKNVFVNDWKNRFFTDPKKRIACIPFMRNLIEFTRGEQDPDYLRLSSLLHWTTESQNITENDLSDIYNRLIWHKRFYGNSAYNGHYFSACTRMSRCPQRCKLRE